MTCRDKDGVFNRSPVLNSSVPAVAVFNNSRAFHNGGGTLKQTVYSDYGIAGNIVGIYVGSNSAAIDCGHKADLIDCPENRMIVPFVFEFIS
jgi:hypothetical protein